MDDAINSFIDHVEFLYQPNAGHEDGFSAEFYRIKHMSAALKQDPNFSSSMGEDLSNKKKNRYKDILPFDYSRVTLPTSEGNPTDDYINASFIKGANQKRSYIASQGPLPHTVNDFWRMLWSYNIKVIIMVCREVELGKRKCERYWGGDNNQPQQFLDIKVEVDSEVEVRRGIFQRHFTATKGTEKRSFFQLQYVAWPDHGTPRTREEILFMIRTARNFQPREEDQETPLCVHCSAGCGRTGAILVIDYFQCLLQQKKLLPSLTIFDVVSAMRKQRPAIVQTKEQYEFVHLAVSEMFTNYLKDSCGKSPTSKLSAALTSQNYENVVLATAPPDKPKIASSYENVPDFKTTSGETTPRGVTPRETTPRGIAPKGVKPRETTPRSVIPREPTPRGITPRGVIPRGSPPSKPHRPVSSFEPLAAKKSPMDVRKTSVGAFCGDSNQLTSTVAAGNLRKNRSLERASPPTTRPKPRTRVPAGNYMTPNTPPNPPTSATTTGKPTAVRTPVLPLNKVHDKPQIKPRPKVPTKPQGESIQARKDRLWSHADPQEGLSRSKPQISSSAVDLRSIHIMDQHKSKAYDRNVSVDNRGGNQSSVSASVFLSQDAKKKGSDSLGPEMKIIQKKTALTPPAKPPKILPKKSFYLKKKPVAESKNEDKPQKEDKAKVVDGDKVKVQKEDKPYLMASNKNVDNTKYTHLVVENKSKVEGEYDMLQSSMKRNIKTFGNPEKIKSGNTKPQTKSLSGNPEPIKFSGNPGKMHRPVSALLTFAATPYSRSKLGSASSNVFESPVTSPGESPDKTFPEFDLHGSVERDSKAPVTRGGNAPRGIPGSKPKVPPAKPVRLSFSKNNLKPAGKSPRGTSPDDITTTHDDVIEDVYSRSHKSTNYYSTVPTGGDVYSFATSVEPQGKMEGEYEEVQVGGDRVDSISSNSFSSVSSGNSNVSRSNKPKLQPRLTPSPSQELPPSLPNRTPESYEILETTQPTKSQYEELAPGHAETGRRSSGAGSYTSKMKEKMAKKTSAITDKLHNLKISTSKNFEDDSHTNRPRKTSHQPNTALFDGQDFNYNNRIQRKPNGPRQKPRHWQKN